MSKDKPLSPETFNKIADYGDMAHRMAKDIMAAVQEKRMSLEEFNFFCVTLSNMHTNIGKAFAREVDYDTPGEGDTFH